MYEHRFSILYLLITMLCATSRTVMLAALLFVQQPKRRRVRYVGQNLILTKHDRSEGRTLYNPIRINHTPWIQIHWCDSYERNLLLFNFQTFGNCMICNVFVLDNIVCYICLKCNIYYCLYCINGQTFRIVDVATSASQVLVVCVLHK